MKRCKDCISEHWCEYNKTGEGKFAEVCNYYDCEENHAEYQWLKDVEFFNKVWDNILKVILTTVIVTVVLWYIIWLMS